MPSVMQRMIQSSTAGHDDGLSTISISNGTVTSRRVTVTALAGVAIADGPNELSEIVTVRAPQAASTSGPIAAVTVTDANDPTASASGTTTMPSISGASRCVRPT